MGTEDEKHFTGFAVQEPNGLEVQQGEVSDNVDNLQRRLGNRQIQLIAIGGSIGTSICIISRFESQTALGYHTSSQLWSD